MKTLSLRHAITFLSLTYLVSKNWIYLVEFQIISVIILYLQKST